MIVFSGVSLFPVWLLEKPHEEQTQCDLHHLVAESCKLVKQLFVILWVQGDLK